MGSTLIEQLRDGEKTPLQAVEEFELGDWVWVGDIPLDSLEIKVLDCGLPSLNKHAVFKKGEGELIVLGAFLGHGKSAMMMQICEHVARTTGAVGVFTTEMSRKALLRRMLLKNSHGKIKDLPLAINVQESGSVSEIIRAATALHRRHPLSLIAIDHVQNVGGSDRSTRNNELAGVSRELKRLALNLQVPILTLSQINRNCVSRAWDAKRQGQEPNFIPTVHDLRDSGGIGQDADVVVVISQHEKHQPGHRVGQVDVSIEKNRDGSNGHYIFKFDANTVRFLDPTQEIEGI